MNNYKKYIIDILNEYKCQNTFDELKCLPVYDDKKNIYAYLVPITFQYKLTSPEYVHLLSKWRKENPIGFASIFEITDQRTEHWLDNILLKREDRILFMIETFDRTALGHIGYSSFNFKEKSCEIDNVVRGKKEKYSGIMTYAMNSIIHWGVNKLKLNQIYLRVLADNTHAIKFYQRLGFYEIKKIPLYKVTKENEIKWVELENRQDEEPDRYYSYMKYNIDLLVDVKSK
ncbi:MAG: GNAT family N-acetyltransferase [Candidatus Marinimicrobia bacterium]|nr:GNAT family N-acetyltransferase [Candidatus Neomarinimicrobiota bacterium]